MNTVYKYEIDVMGVLTFEMPKGAEVLCIREQFGRPKMWAKVDDSQPLEKRSFAIVGTGNPIPRASTSKYIGTFFHLEGRFVGHVFEINS